MRYASINNMLVQQTDENVLIAEILSEFNENQIIIKYRNWYKMWFN